MTKKHKKAINKYSKLTKSLVILGIITLGVIAFYTWPTPKPTPIAINLVGNSSGFVDLSLSPSSINIEPNQQTIITLSITGGDKLITAAQIELAYDETKLGTPTIVQGDFLTNVLSSVKTTGGKIAFTYAVAPADGGKAGSGTLATIKFTPTVASSTTLTFTTIPLL